MTSDRLRIRPRNAQSLSEIRNVFENLRKRKKKKESGRLDGPFLPNTNWQTQIIAESGNITGR